MAVARVPSVAFSKLALVTGAEREQARGATRGISPMPPFIRCRFDRSPLRFRYAARWRWRTGRRSQSPRSRTSTRRSTARLGQSPHVDFRHPKLTGPTPKPPGATSELGGATSELGERHLRFGGATSALAGATSALGGATSELAGATSALAGATSELGGATSALAGATSALACPKLQLVGSKFLFAGTPFDLAGTDFTACLRKLPPSFTVTSRGLTPELSLLVSLWLPPPSVPCRVPCR
jgi:hypothetical protein